MSIQWKDYMRGVQESLNSTNYVGPHDIPDIDLYMDQVTSFMDAHLASSKRFDSDKLLTKTMINNYTKDGLLPPPIKKKYSKDHMYMLVFIYYLKNFLSISDVKTVIGPMSEMFFDGQGGMKLEDIYSEIFNMEEGLSYALAKDVMKKFVHSRDMFKELGDEKEREYMQIFSFIAMLSFDVYLKRSLIESIIDDVLTDDDEAEAAKALKAAKAEAKKAAKAAKAAKGEKPEKPEKTGTKKASREEVVNG